MTTPAAASQQSPLPRNVYKVRGKVLGQHGFFAVTTAGDILGASVHFAGAGESDAQLVRRLRNWLDAVDPVRRLRLVPRTVTPSFDGPSLTHPELTGEGDLLVELRELLDEVRRAPSSAAIDTDVMPDVFDRLSQRLAEPA